MCINQSHVTTQYILVVTQAAFQIPIKILATRKLFDHKNAFKNIFLSNSVIHEALGESTLRGVAKHSYCVS